MKPINMTLRHGIQGGVYSVVMDGPLMPEWKPGEPLQECVCTTERMTHGTVIKSIEPQKALTEAHYTKN